MELDFDKYCLVDGSPTTVLPSPRPRLKVANRKSSGEPKYGNDTPILNADFNFSHYRSSYCRDVRLERVSREDNEVLKRGSVYQSSEEVGRKKIEFSRESASEFSFGIIDSLCSSDEDSSLVEENSSSVCENQIEFHSQDSPSTSESVNLHESLSTKLASPAKSESNSSRTGSPIARFSPVRKMFDSRVKSDSRRSPLSSSNETDSKLLLNDMSDKPRLVEHNHQFERNENHNSVTHCSPTHLHGLLKLGNKNGVPFFEFSVKSPEDVYVANTWKSGKALTWIYTFHSLHHRRKSSNAIGWGFKDSKRESPMVGQMHVSCHKGAGEFNDSMVTEFVLYDIIHSAKTKSKSQLKPSHESGRFESSTSQPLAAAELRPELEIAAIIVQVPFEKRESLKFTSGDKKIDEPNPNTSSPGKMHVVIPAGNHSLPIAEARGPSRLLDRWKLGGECDCGGWDMACSLSVFSNRNVKIADDQPLMDHQNPAHLFVQGRKDAIPAFTMRVIENGKYAVDFHAQLSSLQAFSICISILHAAEASTIVEQERTKRALQSDSLKVLGEEEAKTITDAIAEEEKSKVSKKMEEILPSFVINPPVSPISRV